MCDEKARPKDGVTLAQTVLDVRSYQAGWLKGDWNDDVPADVQRELMEVAQRTHMSLDYLCAIYRKGLTAARPGFTHCAKCGHVQIAP